MTEENKETSPKRVDGINIPKNTPDIPETQQEEIKPLVQKRKFNFKLPKINFKKLGLGALILVLLLALGFGYKYYQNQKAAKQTKTEEAITEEQPKPEPVPADKTVYVKVNEGLRLRENPSYNSKTIMTLPFGAKLTVLNEQGEWYNVSYEDKTGWCINYYTTTQKPQELSIRDVDFSKIITTKEGLSLLQPVLYGDYNKDGREEAMVSVLYDGSGAYKDFYIYGYKNGLVLTKYLDLRPSTAPDAFVEGYMGHDALDFAAGKFVLSYPVYKKDDPNCCPTGGKEYVYYNWNGNNFFLDNKVNG